MPDASIFLFPPFAFMITLLDLALVQAFVFGQPLRTFYFTFLIAGVFSTTAITLLAIMQPSAPPGSLHILETAFRRYRALQAQNGGIPLDIEFGMLVAADRLLTTILALLPAVVAAVLASWWVRRRSGRTSKWGQTILAFLQGALIGFGFCVGLFVLCALTLGQWNTALPTAVVYIYLVGLIACPLFGGMTLATLTWLRWRKHQGETPIPA